MLAAVFERCLKRRAIKDTDPYDWEKGELNKGHQSEATSLQQSTQPQTKDSNDAIPSAEVRRKTVSNDDEQRPKKPNIEHPILPILPLIEKVRSMIQG